MKLPLSADNLDGTFPLADHFERAVQEASLDDARHKAVDILQGERGIEALRAATGLFPPKKFESYAPDALVKRAKARLNRMKRAVGTLFDAKRVAVLEIGCGRGEVLAPLASEPNVAACGLDLDVALFEKNREHVPELQNVFVVEAPAEKVPFCAGSFDLVLGYNSMEHFENPRTVVDECHRLLRPGGFMYFHFGPPFNGPLGPHLHNRIGLPYFHHLFSRDVVARHLGLVGKDPYQGKNEWHTRQFRELFTRDKRFECRHYFEEYVWDHLWLVQQLPSDFEDFKPAELVIRAIEVACCKKQDRDVPRIEPVRPAAVPGNVSDATVETQDGNNESALLQCDKPDRFGIMLNNPDDPRKDDFTRLKLSIPATSGTTQRLSLRVHNSYQNAKYTGRVCWILRVDGREFHIEDISTSREPRSFDIPVEDPGATVELEIELRALRNCEPWKWGRASRLFIDRIRLT